MPRTSPWTAARVRTPGASRREALLAALLGLFAVALLATPAGGTTVTLPATADSSLWEDNADRRNGTATTMNVQSRSGGRDRRSVVRFDLSAIPAGSQVTAATLELYLSTAPAATRTYHVHRVTRAWVEAEVTWNEAANGVPWTTAGGDYQATPSASVTTGTVSGVWLVWDVTADVQAWYSGAAPNHGLLVKDSVENSTTAYTGTFATREHGTATLRPRLVVTYTPPDLQITGMTVDASVVSGDTVTVAMTVTNNGPVAIRDVVPSALSVSGTATVTLVSGPQPATVASLASGQSATFTWTYTVTGSIGQTYRFSGSASAEGGLVTTTTATTNQGSIGAFGLSASPTAVVAAATNVQVQFTVENGLASGTVDRVTITDPDVTIWRFTDPGWGDNDTSGWNRSLVGGDQFRFSSPSVAQDIAAGSAKTFTVTFSLIGNPGVDTSYTFAVAVRRRGGGTTTLNVALTVRVPSLRVESVVVDSSVASGDAVRVVMTVRNIGSTTLTGVTPSALTPGGTAATTLTAGPVPATVASLSANATTTFEWTYTITGAVGDTYSFSGSASANGGTVTASSVTSNTGQVVAYGLDVAPTAVAAGATAVQLRFTVTNNLTTGTLDQVTVRNPNTSIWQTNATWDDNDASGWTASQPTADQYRFTSPAASADIAAGGASKTFTVTFASIGNPGTDTAYTFSVGIRRRGGATTTLTVRVTVTRYVVSVKSVTPSAIPADGVSTARVTVTLTRSGVGQAGQTITFTTTAGSFGGASSTTAVTDTNGDAWVDLTAAVSGSDVSATVTASYASTGSASTTVTFTGLSLTLTASPTSIPADGVTASTLTLTLTSAGTALAGRLVAFTTTAGSLSAGSALTDTSGRATVTLTAPPSKSSGSATVTADYRGLTRTQGLTFTGITIAPPGFLAAVARGGEVTAYWENATGYFTETLIVRRAGAAPTADPVDGVSYRVGDTLVDGSVVVYRGTGGSVAMSGLTGGTTYHLKAYTAYATPLYSVGVAVSVTPPTGGAGAPAWEYAVQGGDLRTGVTMDLDGGVYASAGGARVLGLDAATGAHRWAPARTQASLRGGVTWAPHSGTGFASAYLVAGDAGGRAYAVDPATGAVAWEVTLPGAEAVQALPVEQMWDYSGPGYRARYGPTVTDLVFFVSRNASTTTNRIYALRLADGALMWQFNATGGVALDGGVGVPVVDMARSRLYVPTRAGATGTQPSLWTLSTLDGSLVGSLALGHVEAALGVSWDWNTLYVGATRGTLYAVDLTGAAPTVRWSYALGGALVGFVWEDFYTPGLLHLATADGTVRALQDSGSAAPPTPVWQRTIPGPSALLLLDTTAVVGSSDGRLYELLLADGTVLGSVQVGDGRAAVGDPTTGDGVAVVVGTAAGKLYRFATPLP